MIDQKRLRELEDLYWNETEDPETWDWRDDLTTEEDELIKAWEKKTETGFLKICKDILENEKKRAENGRKK